ncbi:MAG TPA: ATP-binding protein [Candidatus Acidoferrales bacterium]|nr:ATP-binding protein [Candidatus Acidoferrales bacterium]
MSRKRDFARLSRGLRFRLTTSYAVLFTLIFFLVAWFLWARLEASLDKQVMAKVDGDWGAMKGYMRIEPCPDLDNKLTTAWYYDQEDPDETTIVFDLRKIYMVADQNGNPIHDCASQDVAVSTAYDDIGVEKPEVIQKQVREMLAASPKQKFYLDRKTSKGEPVKIRYGIVYAEGHRAPYYVAIGTLYSDKITVLHEFTWIYMGVIPGALILGSLLGFFMAGRALEPVLAVAQAAQRISSSNLSLRIPTRQAGDELDYLILTFNRMIERLEASFQQMRQFSTDVSHELRTPITAIRGQLEVALFTAKTTDQYREAMFNALQDIDRLSQIVRALLLLSQAESGQLVLQKTRLNLCEVVDDLVEQFQIPAEAAGLKLTSELPPECPAEVDRVQIERMLTNLLSNAIKFTPEGGRVRTILRCLPEAIELVVEDTGRGIPTEHLSHIFDRFYRVAGDGAAPGPEQGLGLGLSFVAWIVKAHGGKVEVDSTPGKGTRFVITLPNEAASSDALDRGADDRFLSSARLDG